MVFIDFCLLLVDFGGIVCCLTIYFVVVLLVLFGLFLGWTLDVFVGFIDSDLLVICVF